MLSPKLILSFCLIEDCTRQLVAEVGEQNIKMTSSSGDVVNSALNNMVGGWVPDDDGNFEFYRTIS